MSVQVAVDEGVVGVTYTVATTDAAQSIATNKKYFDGVSKGKATGALVTVAVKSIRFAFGVDPTTSFGHLCNADGSIELVSWQEVNDFRFISAASGQAATLTITIRYGV